MMRLVKIEQHFGQITFFLVGATMDEIRKQVARANRRLTMQLFLTSLGWLLFFALIVAMIAIAIPKIWFISFLAETEAANIWNIAWLAGSIAVAILTAILFTLFRRQSLVETAVEVDHEFSLRERLSSALALNQQERDSEIGRALIEDAERRADRIDVSEKFKVSFNWRAIVPLVLAGCAFGLAYGIQNAQAEKIADSSDTAEQRKAIKEAEESLRKKLRQQLAEAKKKGLKDAQIAFEELNAELNKLNPGDKESAKKMLSKLNNVKDQLKKRQEKIGDTEAMKKQLSKLSNLQKGAADKVADNLKSGDYDKAKDALNQLADKIGKNELSDEEKKQLGKQMEDLSNKLKEMTAQNEAAKQELKEKIERAKQQGDLDSAARMQNQLDQMQQQQNQMDQLNELAKQMQNAAQNMKEGEGMSQQQIADAQDALKQMADQLQQMQNDAESMEALEGMQDQLAEAKCQCQGGNSTDGEGMEGQLASGGAGKGKEGQGNGMGEGQGFGERPEKKNETKFYDSKVAGKVKEGEAVIAGKVDGQNVSGTSKLSTREQIAASINRESDPQTDLRLQRAQREHTKEYFEKFRKGK